MKTTEIIDRIAIVFNNLEHNGDTKNANLLAELMNDIKALHIADVSESLSDVVKEQIEDALYTSGCGTPEKCSEITSNILYYLKDADIYFVNSR